MSDPLRLVYVLVSDPDDYFAEMAIVSMWAARHLMPGIPITVLTDAQTESGLAGVRAKVRDFATELKVVETGTLDDPMARSRWIKTTMRRHLTGDFLYLDVDAVPVRPLDELGTIAGSVAAALDGNVPAWKFVFHDYERVCFEKTGWPFPIRPYFNGGVLWVRDDPLAHRFFDLWHELWQESRRVGPPKDQPGLNYANLQLGHVIQELPPQWNALSALHTSAIWRAKVIHYTSIRFEERDDVEFIRIAKSLRSTGSIDQRRLLTVLRTGYPWTDRNSFDNHILLRKYWQLPLVAARRAAAMRVRP